MAANKSSKVITCMHYKKKFQGGGINRFKKHLAGIRGDVGSCKKVSAEVHYQMQENLNEISNKKRRLIETGEEDHSGEDTTSQDMNNEVEEVNLSAPSHSKYIHVAGFWLNPSNQYDITEFSKHRKTISGVHDVIERFAHGNIELQTKLTNELRLFRNAKGDFGRPTTIRNRSMMSPAEWWITYGSSAPNLQKLAIRVLSQTCSSSGCERNWSVFEFIHSKKRDRMEHQRLNDLVYVWYNLKLHQRIKYRGQNYDSISFEDFADNGQWVLEDDPPFLTVEEIEEFRKQMARLQIQANESDDELANLDDLNSDDGIESQGNEDIENTGGVEETTG